MMRLVASPAKPMIGTLRARARAPIHEPALPPDHVLEVPSPRWRARARATSEGRRRPLAANAIDPDTLCAWSLVALAA